MQAKGGKIQIFWSCRHIKRTENAPQFGGMSRLNSFCRAGDVKGFKSFMSKIYNHGMIVSHRDTICKFFHPPFGVIPAAAGNALSRQANKPAPQGRIVKTATRVSSSGTSPILPFQSDTVLYSIMRYYTY